ncbi:MAG: hypothetical protein R2725_00565 [Solirubrobacterales bacterium]
MATVLLQSPETDHRMIAESLELTGREIVLVALSIRRMPPPAWGWDMAAELERLSGSLDRDREADVRALGPCGRAVQFQVLTSWGPVLPAAIRRSVRLRSKALFVSRTAGERGSWAAVSATRRRLQVVRVDA